MKKEIRILGIDDGPFDRNKKGNVLVVGTVFRGGSFLDGLVSTNVRVDGNNSTRKLIDMINSSKFKTQIQAVFLDGIAVGGFNVVDIYRLYDGIKIPVIVIMRDYPNYDKIFSALRKIGKKDKITLIKKAGEPVKLNEIYVQSAGISIDDVKELLRISCVHSFIPEPIRAAHMVARGIVLGESRGGV